MANEQNLIPLNQLTKKEQREIASKGGKASVKARRERKAMKEQAQLLLSLPLKDKAAKDALRKLGIDSDNIDNQMAMIVKIWNKALKGDIQAASFLRDLCGEKPIEKVDVTAEVTENPFKELTTEELRKLIESASDKQL